MKAPYKWMKKDLDEIERRGTLSGKNGKKDNTRLKKFRKQYREHGWTDADTWSLDYTFAQWITPRLKRFKEITPGWPGGDDMTQEKWHAILQEMIDGFELMGSQVNFSSTKEQSKKIEKAVKLFSKWVFCLWW